THHQPQCFDELFAGHCYREKPVTFRHEPVLLETGGGIANVADLLGNEPFLVYNADILSDLPLRPLIAEHERAGNIVTLALRSGGGPQHISLNRDGGTIVDIRNMLGTGAPEEFVFTGIYAVQPGFLQLLEHGVKRSVIPTFLEMIRRGEKLGGVVIDDGHWWDVGTRAAYLQLHRDLPQLEFPGYGAPDCAWRNAVHASAFVEDGATLRGCSVIGAHAHVAADSNLNDTIVWAGAQIASRSELTNCIVRRDRTAEGNLRDTDI
ncbi:MAG: hypothetical protein M3Y69_08255, partial [Verrucomicrobiota bacterium]|nr:hypothetical protein [Verrucomicrobiota bacterium]